MQPRPLAKSRTGPIRSMRKSIWKLKSCGLRSWIVTESGGAGLSLDGALESGEPFGDAEAKVEGRAAMLENAAGLQGPRINSPKWRN